MRTAETRRVPDSRTISPTALIVVHDERPAVMTATASVAHVARWSPPKETSRVARVSKRFARA
jgi:hypothetical protein